jgi:hypothetical protein
MSEAKVTLPYKFKEINPSAKDIERFWSKVDKRGEDECWEWKYGKSKSGYGNFWLNGLTIRSNRAAWVIANGPIKEGLFSCHKCDNPGCCNPKHLFLATNEENTLDRHLKGRTASGDRNGARRHKDRMPRGDNHYARTNPEKLARGDRHFSRTKPERVARGDRNGAKTKPEMVRRGESHGMAKLNVNNVLSIRARFGLGENEKALAAEFGVTPLSIINVVTRKRWSHVP